MFHRNEPTTTAFLVRPGPQGQTRGLTWLRDDIRRRRRRTAAIVSAGLLGLTGIAAYGPGLASAGKGGGGGNGGSTPSGSVQSCANLSGSITFDDINTAIGTDPFHKPASRKDPVIDGTGVDVALIDTGVIETGLAPVIDGPDLSFDALQDNLRHHDLHGHGTNMAGIISANGAAGIGVAPGARIVNVKVGAADGAVDVSQVIAGIDWVVQNRTAAGMNIRVINLAFGTDAAVDYRSDPLTHAVENAWRNGIVVVVAGGNDGRGMQRLGNPALDPYVIAVGAAELGNGKWKVPSYSSTGDGTRNVDVVAPGTSVLSLGVAGSYLATQHPAATCLDAKGNLMLRGSGTSQAAAVVSGAVAMLLQQRPGLAPDQVKRLLVSTATDLTMNATMQGHGMIDVGAALTAPTPSVAASTQSFPIATGTGTLEAARGTQHVGAAGDQLTGELTAFGGSWSSAAQALARSAGTSWSNQIWTGNTWIGGTWAGSTWSGASWSGASWSGSTWSGASWSGASWSGASWSGASWSGSTWSGSTWSGSTWSGSTWSGSTWSGSTWS